MTEDGNNEIFEFQNVTEVAKNKKKDLQIQTQTNLYH